MTLLYPVASNAAHPAPLSPEYRSSIKRAPQKPLIPMRHTLSELTGPVYGHEAVRENDNDLTTQHKGEPLGASTPVRRRPSHCYRQAPNLRRLRRGLYRNKSASLRTPVRRRDTHSSA